MHQGHCVMDKAGKDKEDTSIDEILTMSMKSVLSVELKKYKIMN